MNISWVKVCFVVQQDDLEKIESELFNQGAISISLSDPDGSSIFEIDDDEFSTWNQIRVSSLFSSNQPLTSVSELIQRVAIEPPEVEFIQDQEWTSVWKESIEPIQVGKYLIHPTETEDAVDEILLKINSGLAFGTGRHPTTQLCLAWLSDQVVQGKSVLDFGCGSGILGIAAKKRGAAFATLVDNDELAMETSYTNADQNSVEVQIQQSLMCDQQYDFIVANILLHVLMEYAGELTPRLRPNGRLALSGILRDQEAALKSAFPSLVFAQPRELDGWLLLEGLKV